MIYQLNNNYSLGTDGLTADGFLCVKRISIIIEHQYDQMSGVNNNSNRL